MTADAADLPIDRSDGCVRFWIHVTPRARRAGVGGRHADALRVAVAAPPEAGAANEACIEALARALGVRRAAVSIESGARGRRKRIRVEGDPEALAVQLCAFARKSLGG